MRKIASFVIGALVAGARTPTVSKKAILPCRATRTMAPGMIRLSTSAFSTSVIFWRRSDESPTCSGLTLGRLWAETTPVVTRHSRTASSRALALMVPSTLRLVRNRTPSEAPRYQHRSGASSHAGRKYESTLTSFGPDSILALPWGCSSVGRAQGWQSWGQGFEPPQLHQILKRGYGARCN